MPSNHQISRHHLPMNYPLRSVWIARGTPCSFTTCYQYNRVAFPIVVVFLHGIKCTILVAQSIAVIIESLASPNISKSVTKSMLTSCHLTSGNVAGDSATPQDLFRLSLNGHGDNRHGRPEFCKQIDYKLQSAHSQPHI